MFDISEETIRLIEALVPLVVFLFGVFFKIGQSQREELAHSLNTVLERLRAGEIDAAHAKEIVLSTGVVSESKIQRVLNEVQLRLDGKNLSVYKDNVIPGVGVSVDSGGNFSVDASGVLNKSAHKLNKWLKKKAGVNIF
ncbi:MAG TPA: hypothetical protein PLK94_07480 [Alphaproteobacteria bacterium]|nr:hypothetical protein [Alphaproteobacteria bacterium]